MNDHTQFSLDTMYYRGLELLINKLLKTISI